MKTLLVFALALIARDLAAQTDTGQVDRRAAILIANRCTDCHAVAALKVKGVAQVGPDLSSAYTDVPARYAMTLERFFDQPVGIMKGLLGGGALAPATRDSLITLFRDLYNEQLARQDSARRAPAPAPAPAKPQ